MQSCASSPGAPSPWDSVLGAIEDNISQCTFLQMTYTAENPHADGSAALGARPRFRPPRCRDPHATSPAPTTTGWREDRCPVVSKRPLHSRAATGSGPMGMCGEIFAVEEYCLSPILYFSSYEAKNAKNVHKKNRKKMHTKNLQH